MKLVIDVKEWQHQTDIENSFLISVNTRLVLLCENRENFFSNLSLKTLIDFKTLFYNVFALLME